MKHIATTFTLFHLLSCLAFGQVITTNPVFPAPDQPLTITFDATKGTGGLEDYTGDVYAHTGAITNQSADNSDWKYVVAPWSVNLSKAQMQRDPNNPNLYTLEISPSIREFYDVPEGETIEQMAFVFRSSDGSTQTNDLFADVYQSTFNLKFTQPADNPVFQEVSGTVSIQGVASSQTGGTIDLSLLVNGTPVTSVTNDTLEYTYQAQTAGEFELALAGTDGSEQDTVYKTLHVYPRQSDQNRPAELKDGITYVDDTTVRFSLFAPHKEFVYLIGDFSNPKWEVQSQYLMNKDVVNADSTYYWIELNGLTPGKEYGFQYLVDGNIRLTDPYVEKILDPYNDQYIDEDIYPNLMPYPAGETEHLVGVFEPGKTDYVWQHNNYDRPEKEELVIYELLVRDFVAKHDFQTLTDTLDYLDRLGVNAIELMPVMEFDANSSWGYNPTFHLATDKYYGPAKDLKAFIDEAHSRGMVVILDMVLNHAWGPSPLVRLWNEGDYGAPTAKNPYLNTKARHDFNVGYDFNHENKATQYFVDRVNTYWLREFNFDGFRFDLSKGFTQTNTLGNTDAWGQYDASRVRLLKRMADQIWAVDDSAYVILEHFAENQEEQELSSYGMMLWGNANHSYNEATMGYHDNGKSDFSHVSYTDRGWTNPHLVGYMESHDEQRIMFKNLKYGNNGENYNVKELTTALDRTKLAAAFFFTIPGPKMIWQFGELGYDISIDKNGRTGEKPVKWEYYSDSDRKRLYDTFKALIRLRKSHPAFTSDESSVQLDLEGAVKRTAISHPDMEALIIGNFGVTAQEKKAGYTQSGTWYEFFSGDTLKISDPDTSLSLQPGELHLYTTKKFKKPAGDLLGGGTDAPTKNPGKELVLEPNYPNPFKPGTTIPYRLPEGTENATFTVYDILGRVVIKQQISADQPSIRFTPDNLSSGVYIYQIRAGNQVKSRKMMLVK